jgi:hypothetical protein
MQLQTPPLLLPGLWTLGISTRASVCGVPRMQGSAPERPRSLRMESRRDLRYCEYGMTLGFAGCGGCGRAGETGRLEPISAERPRTSAGEGGDVGGGTAGTLGDGLSDLLSARFLRRIANMPQTAAARQGVWSTCLQMRRSGKAITDYNHITRDRTCNSWGQ